MPVRETGVSPGAQAGTLTPGTSAYDELALAYNGSDNQGHVTDSPHPSRPGHFDDDGCGGF